MPCPSCNKNDHSRSSSTKCEFYNPRPSKLKPNVNLSENEFFDTSFGYTIKLGLNNFLKNKELSPIINTRVQQVTSIAFNASRLLNLHLLRCFENDLDVPVLTDKYIRQVFSIVQKNSSNFNFKDSYDQELLETNKLFDYNVVSIKNSTQMMTIFTNGYLVNLNNHVEKLYWSNLRKFCIHYFHNDQVSIEQCIEFFENSPSHDSIIQTYSDAFLMFQQDNLMVSNYKSTKKLEEITKVGLSSNVFYWDIFKNPNDIQRRLENTLTKKSNS